MKEESTTRKWFDEMEAEAMQVKDALAAIKKACMPRFHIEHGARIMALGMGIKRIAHTPADKLFLWSVKRYRKEHGRPFSMESAIRSHVFYYGRDVVQKQLSALAKKGRAR